MPGAGGRGVGGGSAGEGVGGVCLHKIRPRVESLPSYAVVSPVRDEADHLARTAESLLAQTHPFSEWVVVDDGSTDGTGELARAYAERDDRIRVVDSGSSHRRARGAPIVRAFDAGRASLRERPEVVVKLDGDLFLPAHYFEWVARAFHRDPRAGVVGGDVLIHDGRHWAPERASRHMVNGVAKAYRSDCLDDFGGLRPSMGWDGIDEYAARARSWNVHVLSELTILHYKRRGSKQSWPRARWEEGLANHYMGYTPEFLLVRVVYRMLVEPPFVVGGLTQGAAFAFAHLTRARRVDDALAVAALRAEQRARLWALLTRRPFEAGPGLPEGGPAFWDGGVP